MTTFTAAAMTTLGGLVLTVALGLLYGLVRAPDSLFSVGTAP